MSIITNTIDSILDRKARFVAKAGERVIPMLPSHFHVIAGQQIVEGNGEVYTVKHTDWSDIRMTLDRPLVFDTKMSDFRHLNPLQNKRYGRSP